MKKKIAFFMSLMLIATIIFSPIKKVKAETNTNNSIEQIVSEIPLEQKVALMLMPSFKTWNGSGVTKLNKELENTIKKYNFGGVILFLDNTTSVSQTTNLVNSMQEANLSGGAKSSLFVSIDQEGGYISRLQTGTQMPGSMAIAATGDPNNAFRAASVTSKELDALGINVNFSPVMDVNNNPDNPVIGVRSFSDDPDVVAEYGKKYIEGLHSNNVMTALKHFPGHGDTETDSHTSLPLINKSYDEIKDFELIPYEAAVKNSDFIMTAHIQYPQIETGTYTSKLTGRKINLPATLSKTILSDILRDDLGYEGIIITDALNMNAIASHFDKIDVAKLAINAGTNMLLMPIDLTNSNGLKNLDNYIASIVKEINNGNISIDKVNDSVTRILKTKAKYGLLSDEYKELNSITRTKPSVEVAEKTVGCKEHHDIEWDIALSAVTSVKDDDTLPITNDKKVVIFYPYTGQGELPAKFTIDKLNENGKDFDKNNVKSVQIRKNFNKRTLDKEISNADEVICISAYYDSSDKWQDSFYNNVIDKTHDKGKKAYVISSQLPYDTAFYPDADAILACYSARGMTELPAYNVDTKQYGANIPASLYVLFGGAEAKGKMPVKID